MIRDARDESEVSSCCDLQTLARPAPRCRGVAAGAGIRAEAGVDLSGLPDLRSRHARLHRVRCHPLAQRRTGRRGHELCEQLRDSGEEQACRNEGRSMHRHLPARAVRSTRQHLRAVSCRLCRLQRQNGRLRALRPRSLAERSTGCCRDGLREQLRDSGEEQACRNQGGSVHRRLPDRPVRAAQRGLHALPVRVRWLRCAYRRLHRLRAHAMAERWRRPGRHPLRGLLRQRRQEPAGRQPRRDVPECLPSRPVGTGECCLPELSRGAVELPELRSAHWRLPELRQWPTTQRRPWSARNRLHGRLRSHAGESARLAGAPPLARLLTPPWARRTHGLGVICSPTWKARSAACHHAHCFWASFPPERRGARKQRAQSTKWRRQASDFKKVPGREAQHPTHPKLPGSSQRPRGLRGFPFDRTRHRPSGHGGCAPVNDCASNQAYRSSPSYTRIHASWSRSWWTVKRVAR